MAVVVCCYFALVRYFRDASLHLCRGERLLYVSQHSCFIVYRSCLNLVFELVSFAFNIRKCKGDRGDLQHQVILLLEEVKNRGLQDVGEL